MKIALVNLANVPEDVAEKMAEGLQLYADRVCLRWEKLSVPVKYFPGALTAPDGWIGLYIFDKPTQPGLLGFHDVDPKGNPYGRAFRDVIPGDFLLRDPSGLGGSLMAVLTHELAEIIGDRWANYYVRFPFVDQKTGQAFSGMALELCDMVQETAFALTLADGTQVDASNFVHEAYFNPSAPADARFDEMELVKRPGQLLPGGYAIVEDIGEGGDVFACRVDHPVSAAPWRESMKQAPHSRTHRRLAA